MHRGHVWLGGIFVMSAITACGGGSGGPPTGAPSSVPSQSATPTASPTTTPTQSPTPSASATAFACGTPAPGFSLRPACLEFASANAPAQTFSIAESGYNGSFSIAASSTCLNPAPGRGAATISPMAGATTFTVTPAAASPQSGGTCTFTISDSQGKTILYNVAITNTVVTGQ